MDLGSLPDLPFNKYYTYIASVGALAIFLSLFLETVYLNNQTVFEMGAAAVAFGILGWLVEMYWRNWNEGMNTALPHAISKISPGESPFDYMDFDPMTVAFTMFLSRITVFGGLLLTEGYIYLTR